MIVKIKIDGLYENSWEIISEISSFRYSRITEVIAEKHRIKGGLNDYIKSLGRDSYVYFQAWHKRGSDPINIISGRGVYILNDEGKTIERIN